MTVVVVKRDTKIPPLKATLHQVIVEGSGTTDVLHAEDQKLKEQVKGLNTDVNGLNAKVKDLTMNILNMHVAESMCMDLVFRSLAPKSPSY